MFHFCSKHGKLEIFCDRRSAQRGAHPDPGAIPLRACARGGKFALRRPVSRVLSTPTLQARGRWMAIHLGRPLPDASRDLPGRRRGNPPGLAAVPPLFGLAPGGVYHAVPVAGDAVRSYRTLSPLPAGPKPGWRFAFCGTFPGVSPAGRYPAPCFHGARTFLPPRGFPHAEGSHPAVWRI